MSDYQELTGDNIPYHLRSDSKGARCPDCGRTTWDRDSLGKPCAMPQPSGPPCVGIFPDKFEDE